MTTLALDFTAMMSAAAAQHLAELAAKDARIAELEAEHAAMADQLDRVWSRCERLTNARDSLRTQVAALDALVSERAVAAEQQAFDDLRGSVLAEEAHAAAAAQAQAEAEEAGPVIDLTGEDEAAPAAEGGAGEVPEAKKERADHRRTFYMRDALADGTKLSITSTGDRWEGIFKHGPRNIFDNGFVFNGQFFKSPHAVTKAFAQRITERHPKPTQPGSGWKWLMVDDGPYKGKTLTQTYDAHMDGKYGAGARAARAAANA
jgi:hypothetical protein